MRSRPGRTGAELARTGTTTRSLALALLATGILVGTARAQSSGPPAYETVVSAPRPSERPLEDEAASASVVTSDRTPRSGETLPQLMSELPGVSVTRLGGLGSMATLSLRGSAANQVGVYVDGIPLNSATWGSVDIGSLPIADVDRVEVYRGMSPSAFGGSAIGGIVSLTSRSPEVTGAKAYASAGSWRTGFGGAEVSWAGPRLRLLASANYTRSRGDFSFFSDNGTADLTSDDEPNKRRENNALAQVDGLVRGQLSLPGRRTLTTSVWLFWREKELPPWAYFQALDASLGTRRVLGSTVYDSRDDLGPGGRLRLTAYGGATEQRFRDLQHQIALRPTRTRDRSLSLGLTATATRPVADWLRMSATADARQETFSPFDSEGPARSGPPGTRTFAAVGLEGHALVGDVEILPSLRAEVAHDEILGLRFGTLADTTRPQTYVLPIARLGLLHRRGPWTLRANGGRYARVPTMFERYGNNGEVEGNPALEPESGLNADAGLVLAMGSAEGTGLTVDAALFAARVRNLIEFQQGLYTQRAANVARARVLGAELSLAGRLGRHGRLVAQGTFTDARDVSDEVGHQERQLAQRPRLRAYGRPELRALPLALGWRLGLYGDVDLTGGNYRDPANFVSLPARVLVGAGASLTSPADHWRLVFSAQNLANADVVDLSGFPQPRRSLFLTLEWSSSGNSSSKETVP
jgi:outer membrane cobalamin receptor